MKILVCGAGRITDELLKRVGENWEVTLIEKNEARLSPYSSRFPSIVRLMAEDASSPVVLGKAGLAEQDCVLAMTNDDAVNAAVARFAREADVNNVLAVVRNPEMLPEFHKLDVWTISMATDTARKIYQFLKDPRIRIVDLGEGEGELVELTVGSKDVSRLGDMISQPDAQWRVVGLLRENRLLFPDRLTVVEEGDRLIILGKAELYNVLSDRLAENQPHFPRTYGRQMILGIADDASLDVAELLNEAFYLAQGTHIDQIKTIHEKTDADIQESFSRWSESLQIEVLEGEGNINKRAVSVARENDSGIVVVPYTGKSFLHFIFGNDVLKMAKKLPCPLLLAKFTDPYERLLVPFNGSLAGQEALEIAMDLSRQLDAAVAVVVVVEPSYLRGEASSSGEWEQQMLKQVRELSHVHRIKVEECVRHGNPVKEILAMAVDYQLLVIGAAEDEPGIFSIDFKGLLVDKSPCSVLVVS